MCAFRGLRRRWDYAAAGVVDARPGNPIPRWAADTRSLDCKRRRQRPRRRQCGVPVKNLKARMTVVCCTSAGSFVMEGKGVMASRQVSSSFLACSA